MKHRYYLKFLILLSLLTTKFFYQSIFLLLNSVSGYPFQGTKKSISGYLLDSFILSLVIHPLICYVLVFLWYEFLFLVHYLLSWSRTLLADPRLMGTLLTI